MAIPHNYGTYVVGEIPHPIVHSFRDKDGPIDLTDFTLLEFRVFGTVVSGTVTLSDAKNGEVTYTWADGDTDEPGSWMGYLWAGNTAGTQRYASRPIRWRVERDAFDGDGSS